MRDIRAWLRSAAQNVAKCLFESKWCYDAASVEFMETEKSILGVLVKETSEENDFGLNTCLTPSSSREL